MDDSLATAQARGGWEAGWKQASTSTPKKGKFDTLLVFASCVVDMLTHLKNIVYSSH